MRKLVVALTGMSLLSGCASGLPGLRPLTYQEPGETRIYASYKACPHKAGPNFAPVIAAIALEAASQLIKGFGTALSKGAEGGALPSSVATTNIEVGKDLPQCLVVIRGRFAADADHKNPVALPPVPDGTQPLKLIKSDGSTLETGLPVVYDLQHYIELQLVPSKNNTAITFGPALVYVARSMDGATKGDRSLSIAVKFDRPGHDGVGSVVLIGNRKIGDMTAYGLDERDRLQYEAPWFAAIDTANGAAGPTTASGTGTVTHAGGGTPPSTPAGTTPSPAPSPAPTPAVASGAQADNPGGTVNGPFPYTLTATVIETRPTKEFLSFVASVFTGAEPALTDAVKGQIDPTTRLAAKTSSIDDQSAYATAYAAAQTALLAYCPLPATTSKSDLIVKSAAARTGQLGANKAALAADLTIPFPALIDINTADPAGVAGCTSYR